MLLLYFLKHGIYVFRIFYMYEARSIVFYSWKSMKILDEMFASFHHSFSFFPLPEKISMFSHSFENLPKSWNIFSRDEAPWITETRPSYHKSIKIFWFCHCVPLNDRHVPLSIFWMYNSLYSIIVTYDIAITEYRNIEALFELINTSKIC